MAKKKGLFGKILWQGVKPYDLPLGLKVGVPLNRIGKYGGVRVVRFYKNGRIDSVFLIVIKITNGWGTLK